MVELPMLSPTEECAAAAAAGSSSSSSSSECDQARVVDQEVPNMVLVPEPSVSIPSVQSKKSTPLASAIALYSSFVGPTSFCGEQGRTDQLHFSAAVPRFQLCTH